MLRLQIRKSMTGVDLKVGLLPGSAFPHAYTHTLQRQDLSSMVKTKGV